MEPYYTGGCGSGVPVEGVLGVLPDVLPVFVLLPRQEEPLVAMLMSMMVLLDGCWPQG